jgi:hypothetical protein
VARLSQIAGAEGASPVRWFEYLYPNSYDTLLLAPQAAKVATGAGALLGFVAVALVAGAALFEARDV